MAYEVDGDANDAMLSQIGIADRVVDLRAKEVQSGYEQIILSYHWFTLCVSLDTALKSG